MSDDAKDKFKGKAAIEAMGQRLDGLLGNLKGAIDEISERVRAAGFDPEGDVRGAGGETPQDIEIDTPAGKMRATASIRVGTVEDALAARGAESPRPAPSRGPMSAQAAEAAEPQIRDCAAEIFEEADGATITAELPGVAEAELAIAIEDGVLRIETAGARRYHAELALPEGLDADGLSHRLLNGILEIHLPKSGG